MDDVRDARRSTSWPRVEGTVSESYVSESYSRTNRRTSYRPNIYYTYSVGGTPYGSYTIAFGLATSSSVAAEDAVRRYPRASAVQVYYDPDRPQVAVLEPGATWSSYGIAGLARISQEYSSNQSK